MEAVISLEGEVATLVNVITVEPADQQKVIDLLRSGIEGFFSTMPGFVSSSVLIGKDGQKVISYSQWRNAADIAAFRQDARFSPYLERLRALAKAESIACDVTYVKSA